MRDFLRKKLDQGKELFRDQVGQLEDQVTPSVRLGAMACAGLLLVYFAAALFQINLEKGQAIESLRRDVAFQEQSLEGIDWAARARTSQAQLQTLESRLWPGRTSGLAQASFEKWLRDQLEANGFQVTQLQLRVTPILVEPGVTEQVAEKLERISAKALVALDERGLDDLLKTVSASPYFVTIERLNIRADRTMRLELDVETFRLKGEQPT